ncbi:MarR family winged helix-turn-helix transcriptional regulator [uncultured Leifsonia sp.]|jgi:DNA-binding MarR family transcriptional regulator|uniref:MarR family winged helix-turn-helix transcriptional regulator n=1 Tax=uncultured Leifsonia sp. TaxID=340359 RepID=UPI0025F277FF|nr:MarR family transcriptional regulator [uncultured Leifsonia sp.]
MSDKPWFEVAPAHAVSVIASLREYRTAEQAMRRRTRDSMRMGEADLKALKFLLKAQEEHRLTTPAQLGAHLGMKSSSVTAMLDRLTASGHVSRHPHPTDRRSLTILATPGADQEVRHTLGDMHRRLLAVAAELGPQKSQTVVDFLARLTALAERD